jgi:3'-phosphoadenosine 5'-phosphosulfate sulfotransferase (PAPS reductase)/FAD synthetase
MGMHRRSYNADRVINLHCGLGRDSITMVVLASEGRLAVEGLGDDVSLADIDAVVFSDTGCEWPHTYEQIEAVWELVERHGCRWIELSKDDNPWKGKPSTWEGIEYKAQTGGYHYRPAVMADYQSRETVVSLGKGDCTDNHKIQPLRRFMSDQHRVRFGVDNAGRGRQVRKGEAEPSLVLIGIAADETRRLRSNHKSPSYVEERYPLVTMGIAKTDERAILESAGFGHVLKSGCFMCPYQPPGWFWTLRETQRETFAAVVEYEAVALARNPRMAATGSKRKGQLLRIPEVVDRWRAANPKATVQAVLEKSYERDR